ncbi:hypothetical protein AB3X52_11190 [Nocardioides sp. DS6]|uniref:Uncharacterized protein n=2 Tax=Nocardioides eburneus TaxID=3231482 RepID=A0ABV3T1P1_9ACTN
MFGHVDQQYEAELAYRRDQLRKDIAVRRQRQRFRSRRNRRMDSTTES